MKETPDAAPNQTQNHLQILKAIAENKNSEMLSASYASRVPETFRRQLADNLKQMNAFAYLGKERITADHFILDPTLIEIFHYKMMLANHNVYYHFRVNKNEKVGWIMFED